MTNFLAFDHCELGGLLDEFFGAFETGDIKLAFQKLDFFWARLAMHIRAEHLHLFPALLNAFEKQPRTGESRTVSLELVQTVTDRLRDDHDFFMRELSSAIKQLRELSENNSRNQSKHLSAIREKITAVCHRLEAHNNLEESEVYQWTNEILNSREKAALNVLIGKELNNLPPRFLPAKFPL